MYSDPIGVKRPVRDRLGSSSYGSSPHLFIDLRETLRRYKDVSSNQEQRIASSCFIHLQSITHRTPSLFFSIFSAREMLILTLEGRRPIPHWFLPQRSFPPFVCYSEHERLGAHCCGEKLYHNMLRQPQYVTSRNGALHGERDHVVRKVVHYDATSSNIERDALRSPRSIIVSASEGQKIDRMSAQTPKVASLVESKGRSTTNVISAKELAAPTSGEKKCILLNVEIFLQKLGLSKYIVTFKAEEIDMYALKHMNDDDFKSIGVPMGPRKKFLMLLLAFLKQKSDEF